MVIAGLLTNRAKSQVAKILDGMLSVSDRIAISEALLAEYRGVLLRPKILKLHRLKELEVDAIRTELTRHAIVLTASQQSNTSVALDVGDQFLWNLLASSET